MLSTKKMSPRFDEDNGQILSYHDVNTVQPNIKSSEMLRPKPVIKDVKNVRFDLSKNMKFSPPHPASDMINFKAIEYVTNNPVNFARTPTMQVQDWKNPSTIAQKLRQSIDIKNINYLPRIDSLTTGETLGPQRIERRNRHHLMPWSRTTNDLQKYREQRNVFQRSQSLTVEPQPN